MRRSVLRTSRVCSGLLLVLAACSGDEPITKDTPRPVSGEPIGAKAGGPAVSGSAGAPTMTPTPTPAAPNNPTPANPPVSPITPMTPAMPGGPAPAMPVTPVMPPPMMPFVGPLDGDPSKPMVSIPGIPCGAPRAGFGATPPSVKITNRDVVVAYPCAHEGAAVTFFLFIHGTLQEAQKVAFTMSAFPIHQFVDSHNVIVVVPKAVGTQWGNGDNGADAPHLAETVDWIYAQFGEKFSIRSMWASGGSWGAAYLGSTFACDPKYEKRLRGVRMVVGGGCPRCSSRLACIVAQQELELGGGSALSEMQREMYTMRANVEPYATMHGCDAKMGPTMLGNVRAWTWPNCDKGWAHSYYMGPGQHADAWNDPTALKHMVEEVKSIEN
jgi:hypothetical protein